MVQKFPILLPKKTAPITITSATLLEQTRRHGRNCYNRYSVSPENLKTDSGRTMPGRANGALTKAESKLSVKAL